MPVSIQGVGHFAPADVISNETLQEDNPAANVWLWQAPAPCR